MYTEATHLYFTIQVRIFFCLFLVTIVIYQSSIVGRLSSSSLHHTNQLHNTALCLTQLLLHTDPDVLDFPLLKRALHHYQDRTQAPQLLQDTNKIIVDADAYVFVSAEYNHCLPPALTNLVAHFPGSSFKYKPAGIVCYSMGPFGGQRAAMQARCLLGEIGCPSTSYLFSIPTIQNQLSETGEPLNERMTTNSEKLITELEWYATAVRNHKDTVGIPN